MHLVARVAARHRGLAGALADVTLMHQAHADLLAEAGAASEEAAPRPVPGRSATALALVLTEERGLQRTLAESAGGAASGSFARALARCPPRSPSSAPCWPGCARGDA